MQEPVVLTAPVTVKRTVWPHTGLAAVFLTVAVTVCLVSTGFVEVAGLSVHDLSGKGGATDAAGPSNEK
ncbi:MAG: hypothetical protein DME09_09285 [Candidatus Rokuibacteriota bacterium]|nr:MAG: hypothetical protein DME09_09285 [Candidatus Rokubacteria bacterium]